MPDPQNSLKLLPNQSDHPKHWEEWAKKSWQENNPKLYAELQKSGNLNQAAKRAAEQTSDDLLSMVNQGYDYQSAWEAVRERYLFLPSEEDQPDLGANPGSSPQDSEQETTTESPKQTKSEVAASAPSTETTFPPLEP